MTTFKEQLEELEEISKKIYNASEVGVRFVEGVSEGLVIKGIEELDSEEAGKVLEVLKAEGYKEFAIADSSSGLMDELFAFTEAGCQISGAVKFNQVREYSDGSTSSKEIKAIALTIK